MRYEILECNTISSLSIDSITKCCMYMHNPYISYYCTNYSFPFTKDNRLKNSTEKKKIMKLSSINIHYHKCKYTQFTHYHKFFARKINWFTFSGFSTLRLLVTILPPTMNTLSEGTVVAHTLTYFLATVNSKDKRAASIFHQCNSDSSSQGTN